MSSDLSRCWKRAVIGGALAWCAAGCVGYRLGSMLPPDVRTVYVESFINRTEEPLIEVEVTRAAINEIQRDGSLRVARSAEDADAILRVTLAEYTLTPLAFRADRPTATDEYRLTLGAAVLLTRHTTGEVIVEAPKVTGETTFLLSGDLTSAKKGALPAAASDLGRRIVASLVEAWP